MKREAPSWLVDRLKRAGVAARDAWIDERCMFVEVRVDDDEHAVSDVICAFPAGARTSLVEQKRLGWAYLAPADQEGPSAVRAARLCRMVADLLGSHGDEVVAMIDEAAGLDARVDEAVRAGASVEGQPHGEAPGRCSEPPMDEKVFAHCDDLRRGPYLDHPRAVNFETLAACPGRCSFCTYPSLERRGERMSDALVDKLLGDLEAIPRTVPFVFHPFLISEPFTERRLDSILDRVERRLPHATVHLITTGTLLDAERIASLEARSNVGELAISLNFTDAVEYEAQMGLSWDRAVANLRALHRSVASGGIRFKVVVSRVASHDDRDEVFCQFVRERFPGFEERVIDRHGWLGHLPAPVRRLDELPCSEWFELKVTATGLVTLCCQDSHAEHVLGDAKVAPLLEIYNQPWARARRSQLTARSHFTPCKGCSFTRV